MLPHKHLMGFGDDVTVTVSRFGNSLFTKVNG